jgi:hypothetical protein
VREGLAEAGGGVVGVGVGSGIGEVAGIGVAVAGNVWESQTLFPAPALLAVIQARELLAVI